MSTLDVARALLTESMRPPGLRRMSPPPAGPRRRASSWQPPEIFTYFRRDSDGTIFQVRNVYRRDRQVLLVRPSDGLRLYVFADVLAREFTEIVL